MGADPAVAPPRKAPAWALARAQARRAAQSADRDLVRLEDRHSLGGSAPGTGLRVWDDLLAVSTRLAAGRCLAATPWSALSEAPRGGYARLVAGGGRLLSGSRRFRGGQTGPNPTDRRKLGSKHHIITDAQGIPLAALLTAANAHDVTQLVPLVDAIPPVRGKPGRPRQRPERVYGDRAYDSAAHRDALRARGITPMLAKRRTEPGSGLGVYRWVVERTLAWLHQFRRLRIRFERLPEIHEAFLTIGCALICRRFL
jgi:transposase